MKLFAKGFVLRSIVVLAAVTAVGAATWCLLPSATVRDEKPKKTLTSRKVKGSKKTVALSERRIERQARVRKGLKADSPAVADFDFRALDINDPSLTEEYRKLLSDLQVALGEEDRKSIIALVQRVFAQMSKGEKVPVFVREQLAQALGSCGKDGLAELAGLMADPDVAVMKAAANSYEELLIEADGDRDLSEILLSLMPAVHDHEMLESFLGELGNMRNSVRADAVRRIYAMGNADAAEVLGQNLSSYFGDDESGFVVKGEGDLKEYLERNPDGEDDESFYGPWQTGEDE